MSRLCIATPVYGTPETASVPLAYHNARMALARAPGVEVLEISLFTNTDLVRARSRAVAMAYERGVEHLLFWDADVVAPPSQVAAALRGMLASGHDLIGCSYPKKKVHWDRVRVRSQGEYSVDDPALAGLDFAHQEATPDVVDGNASPCRYVPMGFCLLSRALIVRMVEHAAFRAELLYVDRFDDKMTDVVGLFQLTISEVNGRRLLLSEDFSFCERARSVGFAPWLYVGEGSKLQHLGAMAFG